MKEKYYERTKPDAAYRSLRADHEQGYFHAKDANETVIFDAFYRTNPDGNGFAITAGLEQVGCRIHRKFTL